MQRGKKQVCAEMRCETSVDVLCTPGHCAVESLASSHVRRAARRLATAAARGRRPSLNSAGSANPLPQGLWIGRRVAEVDENGSSILYSRYNTVEDVLLQVGCGGGGRSTRASTRGEPGSLAAAHARIRGTCGHAV